jgi:hypothetical protein
VTHRCAECRDTVVLREGVRSLGQLFCSKECAESYEEYGPPLDTPDVDCIGDTDVYGSLQP